MGLVFPVEGGVLPQETAQSLFQGKFAPNGHGASGCLTGRPRLASRVGFDHAKAVEI